MFRPQLRRRISALFGPDPSDARQSMAALGIGVVAAIIAGLTLGSLASTMEQLPGLLVLFPAAVGLRGAIFGALGARLGTSIHTGTFSLSLRADTMVGQNVLAAGALSLIASVTLGASAKMVAELLGIDGVVPYSTLITISVVGGLLASVVVVGMTVSLAAAAVRYGWDSDNVMSPLITAAADMLTLPALWLATKMVDSPTVARLVALAAIVASALVLVLILRSSLALLRRVMLESLPVLILAGGLSLVGGVVLESRIDRLAAYPALLVLVPLILGAAGSVGGVLSSRLTSKLHLGVVRPVVWPGKVARSDILLAFSVALPTFLLGSMVAEIAADATGITTPGTLDMITVGVFGGMMAAVFAIVVAYVVAILSFRVGLDPDNLAIPLVCSAIDLLGSMSVVVVMSAAVVVGS